MIAYQRRNLERNIHYQLNRSLPKKARILVKAGQEVVPETIIAVGKKQAGYRQINLAQSLEVKPSEVELVKTIGSRVYRGDLLAKADKLWGVKEAQFKSPLEGVLENYNQEQARLTLEYLPESENIAAGMWGKIQRIVPEKEVVIGSLVDRVGLLVHLGNPREGSLVEVGYRDLPLEPKHLSSAHKHKIVWGGISATEEFYQDALNLGVRGVITGGIDYQVYWRLRSKRGRFEDVGLTIATVEGFGSRIIEEKLGEYLGDREGQFVFLNGQEGELILPWLSKKERRGDKRKEPQEKRFTTVKKGQRARILVGEHAGRYGIVGGVLEGSVRIQFDNEVVGVLPQNVEVLNA